MEFRTVLCFTIIMLSVGGCSDDGNEAPAQPREIIFGFADDAEGWVGDFADYPAGAEDFYELIFSYANLPAPLDEARGSLMLSGNNHSDDLFMFVKKQVSGLKPDAVYDLTFNVEFASNVADGTVGVGGSPGEGVAVKVGATVVEPVKELDSYDGYLRMNIDKGMQSQDGDDMIVIGDFSNDTDQSVYTLKTVANQTPFRVQADALGKLWLIVGTDSAFEATTTIYISRIAVLLN
ncbi:MAG: hypothetical protein ABFS42_03020 [Candidatus Krumholzibacteriota bacterium]